MRLALALAVLAGTLAAVILAYRHDLQREHARVAQGSRVAQTSCGPIEYAEAGEGAAVLLVHGSGGGFDQVLEFGTHLAGKGFRAVMPSRFGYLRTPMPQDASPAAQADAHACLLAELGIGRAAVLGASAGAPSAMQFALRHPERTAALVLLVPLAYAPREAPPEVPAVARFMYERVLASDFLFWALLRAAPALVTRTVLATPPEAVAAVTAAEQDRVRRMMWQILPVSLRQRGLLNEAAIAATLPRYPLERIAAPTLVVSARDDLYGTYESGRYTASRIPGARFVGFDSGGHVWAGHHAEVLSELVSFLGKGRPA
jgi:pimeloyl-ACP methyl ester carboxylesterase